MTTAHIDINNFALWTALITPFHPDGSVDYESLQKVVKQQESAGNAILICGSTGEGLAIEQSEQYEIVKFICNMQPSVPLMVAIAGSNLPAQKAWIEQCNDLPIHAYLAVCPIYAKPGVIGQTQWFETLLDASQHPVMIYNVPSRCGTSIPVETVRNIGNHKNLWAMKEASGDINEFLKYAEAAPKMRIYSGEDPLMPYLASAGAVGLVSVCANVWPEATNLYVEKSLTVRSFELFSVWYTATNALFEAANPIPVKVLMHQQGMIASPTLRAPLTHLELTSKTGINGADEAISEWYQQKS